MLILTSYNRMLRYLSALTGTSLTGSYGQKNLIMGWIATVSKQIENYLNRTLEYGSYTEYFDTMTEKDIRFFPKAYPIASFTDVYIEGTGLWDGSESEVDDCFIDSNNLSVVLPTTPAVFGLKTYRLRYTGGLSSSGVYSNFIVTLTGGDFTPEYFIHGSTSDAVGIIYSATATTLVLEILYGIFEEDENITEYSDEGLTSATGVTGTITTITTQSLVEQYHDIVRAAEIQVRYYWKHKDDFELSNTSKDGTNVRSFERSRTRLVPEAITLLQPYKRLLV